MVLWKQRRGYLLKLTLKCPSAGYFVYSEKEKVYAHGAWLLRMPTKSQLFQVGRIVKIRIYRAVSEETLPTRIKLSFANFHGFAYVGRQDYRVYYIGILPRSIRLPVCILFQQLENAPKCTSVPSHFNTLTEPSHEGSSPYVCSVYCVYPPISCYSAGLYVSESLRQALLSSPSSSFPTIRMAARLASPAPPQAFHVSCFHPQLFF